MSKRKELVKNTFIIFLGKFCTQFLSFFLLPIYTGYLTSAQYGTVDLITTYITLFVPIISLQLEMAIFRELVDVRNNESKQKEIITSALYSILIQFSMVLFVYIIISIIFEIPYGPYIICSIAFTLLSNVLLQIARGFGDNISYSISSVIAGTSTILFNILFIVFLNFKIEGMIISVAIGNLIASLYLFFKCKIYRYIKKDYFSKVCNHKLLKYSLPLVPNGLIWWIINVSDRTLISLFLGSAANGIYAVSNKFSNLIIQVYNVFNLSWTESASLHIKDKDKDEFFSTTFNGVIQIFLSISILVLSILPFIFNILIDKSFDESYIYIPILLIGMLFNIIVSFIGCVYVAEKLTKKVASTSLWAGIINIVTNLLLIKYIGIYAAAISTVIAFSIMSLYRFIDIRKYVVLKPNWPKIFEMCILFIISSVFYFSRKKIECVLWSVFVIIILIYMNKSIIDKIILFFKTKLNKKVTMI